MSTGPLVGLLDSGVAAALGERVAAARRFRLDAGREIETAPGGGDDLGHGTALARIILAGAPTARLLDARVFDDAMVTSAAVAAAGLDWLVAEGAALVNMSFGLRHDRAVLAEACARAAQGGVILLAAAPARGAPVYPGAYPEVIRISGDARCAPGQISALGGGQADFGAHPKPSQGFEGAGPAGGASFAVPHAAALLAAHLGQHPQTDQAAARRHLEAIASYHGPERRSSADG
jgi:hypothetical protein